MAMDVKETLKVYSDTVVTIAEGVSSLNASRQFHFLDTLADGTGLDQCDLEWEAQYTITSGSTQSIDLRGSLTTLGQSVVMVRVKLIIIQVVTTTAGYTVEVGGVANDFCSHLGATGDKIILRGGGLLLLYAPDATAYAVTAGTADILGIKNLAGGDCVVNVKILGCSA